MKTLSPEEAFALLERGEISLIDVREPHEWAATGLPLNAVGLSLSNPDFLEEAFKYIHKPTAIICAGGVRSARVIDALQPLTDKTLYNVTAGVSTPTGWLAKGLPVTV